MLSCFAFYLSPSYRAPEQSPGPSAQVTPIPKGKMKSSQNLAAQREAAANASPSPDWVLTSPRSFGTMKDGKVTVPLRGDVIRY